MVEAGAERIGTSNGVGIMSEVKALLDGSTQRAEGETVREERSNY